MSKTKTEKDLSSSTSLLRSVVGGLVRDTFEAQDLVQDAYVEYLEVGDLNSTIENVGAWLVTVAKNKVFDRFRREKTKSTGAAQIVERDQDRLIAQNPDPEAVSWNNELRERLRVAILQLPEDQRQVFVQHEIEGLSFEEISKSTGVGINTLLSRKRYAVQFLRSCLKDIYE